MGKLANTCAKNDIINRLSTGESSNQIANDYNVSGQRIRQIKKENEELIEEKKQELLAELPSVIDIVKTDLDTNTKLSQRLNNNPYNVDYGKIALKNTLDKTNVNVLKIAGILQSPSMQFIGNQTNIQDNSTTISPAFQEYLDFKSKNRQIIDTQEGTESDDN